MFDFSSVNFAAIAIGAMVSFLIGVVVTDKAKIWYLKREKIIKAKYRKIISGNNKHYHENFYFRKKDTGLFIVDGDGYMEYERSSVRLMISNEPDFPIVIEDRIQEIRSEERRKTELGKEACWDGPQLGINSFEVGRINDEASLSISAFVYKSTYFHFLATCAAMLDKKSSYGSRIKAEYLSGGDPDTPVPFLAGGVGVVVALITADRKLISAQRANGSGVRPKDIDLAIAESINPAIDCGDGRTVDVWRTAVRGVLEEVGVEISERSLHFLGFAVDTRCHQFNFIAVCELEFSEHDIRKIRNSGAAGKWELANMQFTPLNVAELDGVLSVSGEWGFDILAAYWATKRGAGRRIAECVFH